MILILPLKTSKRYDIAAPLATWVDSSNPYITSEEVKDDLVRLSSLRNCLTGGSICTRYGHQNALEQRGLEDSMEYYCCLLEAENKDFPVIDDAMVGAKDLRLSWTCAFDEEESVTRANIRYERACVLYNVAVLQSYSALSEDLTTKEGRSAAKTMFGTAATTFEHLKTLICDGDAKDPDPSADLTSPALLMCMNINLAQGQLCSYEAAKNRTQMHGLLAKLAIAAADLYNEALNNSQDPIISARLPKTSKAFGSFLKAMSIFFRARAEYHQSLVHQSEHSYPMEIARLRFAESCLDDALKYKDETAVLQSENAIHLTGLASLGAEISHLRDTVRSRRAEVEKENQQIYMERVPDVSELEKISPASMMAKEKLPPLVEGLNPQVMLAERPMLAKITW